MIPLISYTYIQGMLYSQLMNTIMVARLTEETVLLHYYNTINTPTPNYRTGNLVFNLLVQPLTKP